MNIRIRDAQPGDFDYILGLNAKDVIVLSPMDSAKADYFLRKAELFQVAEVDGLDFSLCCGGSVPISQGKHSEARAAWARRFSLA